MSEKDYHDYYRALFHRFMPEEDFSCMYCHGEDHSKAVSEEGIVPCYQCHSYIKKLIKQKEPRSKNIHDTLSDFSGSQCTACHDPHSSPYPHLLNDEPDSYE